jgi:drug/metabolite transporter (DMT)-like permease
VSDRPSRARLLAAYATVYVVWGSTYLAILYAIETLPPFLMGAARFLTAGSILVAWAFLRGAARPTAAQWKSAAIIGGFLLLGGNGAVLWAEQRVPSGITALLVAILPLWMVILERLGPDRRRPTPRTLLGVLIGIAGMVVLIGPGALVGDGDVSIVGALVLILGSLSWGIGSLYTPRAALPRSPQLASGLQMLAGGAMLAVLGLATGEGARGLAPGGASVASLAALAYLVVFGSLIAYSAFAWLLRVEPPSRVATYAYVNPVVAVFLGWAVAGEALTTRTLVAAAIIVGAVALIVRGRRQGTSSGGAGRPGDGAATAAATTDATDAPPTRTRGRRAARPPRVA